MKLSLMKEEKAKALKPIIDNDIDEKINTKKEDEAVKADGKKVAKGVDNVEERNYDYSPKRGIILIMLTLKK